MIQSLAERRWRSQSVSLALLLAVPFFALPAQLPPEIQADRYLIQAERQIQAGDHAEALATLDKIVALQSDHGLAIPAPFWFKYAQASQDAGRFEQAVESATRYLTEAGQQGQHYMAALEILDASERLGPHPFSVLAEPANARVQILDVDEPYRPGLPLPSGEYRVEVSADGYGTAVETVRHEPGGSTHRVVLRSWAGGENFRDCPTCPEMVVIPAGRFRMGCLSSQNCRRNEKPVRDVVLGQIFGLSIYEVTFEQWRVCAAAGACEAFRPSDNQYGGLDRPVNDISWSQAQSYVSWLSRETRKTYRLPTEAEWEYAARAGSETEYSWGNDIGRDHAMWWGGGLYAEEWRNFNAWSGPGWKDVLHYRTAPVGYFDPNAFGLYDMHGNVWEWVEDCWNGSYKGAPSDGSAWTSGNCSKRVMRGGNWGNDSRHLRSANRTWEDTWARGRSGGFRVARTLHP